MAVSRYLTTNPISDGAALDAILDKGVGMDGNALAAMRYLQKQIDVIVARLAAASIP